VRLSSSTTLCSGRSETCWSPSLSSHPHPLLESTKQFCGPVSPIRQLAQEPCNRCGGDCVVTRLSSEELSTSPAPQRNERVDVQINRMLFVEATKESLNYADKGDYESATRVVEKTISEINRSTSMATQNLKTRAFVDELGSTLSNVKDRNIYQSKGGRAILSQQAQDYGAQRQTYAREGVEGVYQNKFAKSSQARAKTTKSISSSTR
jgi:hypothetical protein